MDDTAKIYFDYGYLSEENKMLRQEAKHWKIMYENLQKEFYRVCESYDKLVEDTLRKDLCHE